MIAACCTQKVREQAVPENCYCPRALVRLVFDFTLTEDRSSANASLTVAPLFDAYYLGDVLVNVASCDENFTGCVCRVRAASVPGRN
jgi:hypothetical protein